MSTKKILNILLLLSITYHTTNQAKHRIEEVKHDNLRSFAWEEKDYSDDWITYLQQCMERMQEGQPFQKRKHAFTLLTPPIENQNPNAEHVMDKTTWSDLQLLYDASNTGDDNEKEPVYLGNIVNQTTTEFGKIYLLSMLAEPTTDIEVLKKRQAIVKELVENEELFDQVEKTLEQAHKEENNVLSFYYPRDPFWQAAQRCYFTTFPSLNNNWLALEANNRWGHTRETISLTSKAAAAVVLTVAGTMAILGKKSPELLKKMEGELKGSAGPVISLFKMLTNKVHSSQTINSLFGIAAGAYCALSIKEDYKTERTLLYLDRCLQTKLIGIKNYLASVQSLKTIIPGNPVLSANIINPYVESDKYAEMHDLLSSPSFEGEPSITSSKGQVLLAYKMIHENNELFMPSFMALAELDFYHAIAKLIKESKGKKTQYNFVEYLESDSPQLELKECWNPFIGEEKAVSNSFAFGGSNKRNCIITGPNAGGKSCNLKACAISLILGQSLGIAPAAEARFTPFSKIMTHLNIEDNVQEGQSKFKAEVLRAKYILEEVENSQPHKFNFVVMDEVFNGTTPNEGQAAAYSYAQNIGEYVNTLNLIATHFVRLTELEEKTDNYTNYSVGVTREENNDIKYTFKLEPGVSSENVAFDILRMSNFSPKILDQAKEFLSSTKEKE